MLTIVIPTFDRASFLEKLLDNLYVQTLDYKNIIKVLIIDNFSSDGTEKLCIDYCKRMENLIYIKNDLNIGPDGNFIKGFRLVESKYFWFIGDDDLPRIGLIKLIISFLNSSEASLIYLPSKWSPEIKTTDLSNLEDLEFKRFSLLEFTSQINIWTTFISSWVVNRNQISLNADDFACFDKTNFIQLYWIFPLLNYRSKLFIAQNYSILATGGNTRGSYRLLNTFGCKFPKLVKSYFNNDVNISNNLIKPFIKSFLPRLIIGKKLGNYKDKESRKSIFGLLSLELKNYIEFWLYCVPVILIPSPFIYIIYKIYKKCYRKK